MSINESLETSAETNPQIDTWIERAILLAADLLTEASAQQTATERRQASKIAGMMHDPNGKTMTMALSDQAFRSHNPSRINDQIRHLVEGYGVPSYFANWEQAALEVGTRIGQFIPHLVVPLVVARLRAETSSVILPGEEDDLRDYLKSRRATGTRLNLNQLGEAILGEEEAARRLSAYLELVARPDVEYISVKISSIFSQINLIAFEQTVVKIKERLRKLYRTAMQHEYVLPDGSAIPKFINLDMEEYGDLHLTIAAFQQVLDEAEFVNYRAGIVLQAYLPDSHQQQRLLTDWARERVARGGAPIKIRIVKGANLAMEQVEASLHGWEQAPYYTKADVDANYKRMVMYGCQPENARVANLGIASHNLFDIAFGMIVRAEMGVENDTEFEMLEGMANHQARAVQEQAGGLLLYAPVVKEDDFHSAISYLVRRLDENTAEENFLHDLFDLEPGNPAWEKQKRFFNAAVARRDLISALPNRRQDRMTEERTFDSAAQFENEPDTDFSLPANQAWAAGIIEKWREIEVAAVPLQINGELVQPNSDGSGHDPSVPGRGYRFALADPEQVEAALACAVAAQDAWKNRPKSNRKALLLKVAEKLAERRADLIGAAILDGGKSVQQADVEVSEAVDFAVYYAHSFELLNAELAGATSSARRPEASELVFEPFGTILIASPWNFPIAIPAGGMLAALMAGNSVIFKPAPEVVLIGWQLVNAFWDAGIPREVLQFVPTTDDAVGQSLVTDERVDAVILTGAYETAQLFLGWKPQMRLFAETSGKNSLIISAMADHDLAIKDLVQSAFGHNGQKCSAASLAVLEAEVYDNPVFLRQLKDAAASLPVGSAWDLSNKVTPLIHPPAGALSRAQTTLEPGESWLLEPKADPKNPHIWSPGIKLGVRPGSFYHQTECFGPVLGLMRADDIEQAIEIVNQSEFGLTGGLHSLDDREIALWRERIEVGNAYINRGTTGAIVQRQPFGGWKKSAIGGGAKAGGPNYVLSLGTWVDGEGAVDFRGSYRFWWESYFSREHDPSQVLGESNVLRFRPISSVAVRIGRGVEAGISAEALNRIRYATGLCGISLAISTEEESDADFASRVGEFERIRFIGTPSIKLLEAAHAAHVQVISDTVTASGRLELRHYLREQAMTQTTHRYGNIMPPPTAT